MIRRLLPVVLLLAVTGCRPPGEPPANPSPQAYHDLMARETDKAASSLATLQQVVSLMQRDKLTENYATVATRQSAADLDGVATDLAQVSAPSPGAETAKR